MGLFIETLLLVVATIPILVPIIVQLGYTPPSFGILMIMLVEMALITSPVGLNPCVVQAARDSGSFRDVMIGVIPYAIAPSSWQVYWTCSPPSRFICRYNFEDTCCEIHL